MCSSATLNSFGVVSGVMSCFETSINHDRNTHDECVKFGFSFAGTAPMRVTRSKTIGQCKSICRGKLHCDAFTFAQEEGRCLLYGDNHNEYKESSWARDMKLQSAVMSCYENEMADDSDSCLIEGRKYARGLVDTVTLSTGTVDQCAEKCQKTTNCEAFTVCTAMKLCWLFNAAAFSVEMRRSKNTKSFISSKLSCYLGDRKEEGKQEDNLREDTCMEDSRRIWGGNGSFLQLKRDISSYYACKSICERTVYCKAFSLCKTTHVCLLFKDGFKLKSQTVDSNWCSGLIECYDKEGKLNLVV